MKKTTMFVLISHQMTESQQTDAQNSFDIDCFVSLYEPNWSNIPPHLESIEPFLSGLKQKLMDNAHYGDYLFVQGDFGGTQIMVNFAKSIGVIPVYATTERKNRDIVDGEKIISVKEFQHVRFRQYEG